MEKIVYKEPLDIFLLFRSEDSIRDLCQFLVEFVVKDADDLRQKGSLVMPVVKVGNIGYNIDINYFLFVLSEYVGNEKLLDDWKSLGVISFEKQKMLALFFNAFLTRTIEMVYISRKIYPTDKINGAIAIAYHTKHFNQVVYKNDIEVVQFNAVVLIDKFLSDYARSSLKWDSFVELANSNTEQVAFGLKECNEFWKRAEQDGLRKTYFIDPR